MSELGKELTDLKREVVESRNQSIKTDNQVKNLTLDVKGFENRFDDIEKKFRLATLGSYLVFSLVFGVASYFIASARISVLKTDYEQQKQAAEALKNDYQVKLEKGLAAEKKRGELAQRVTHARDRALTFFEGNGREGQEFGDEGRDWFGYSITQPIGAAIDGEKITGLWPGSGV